MNSAEVAAGGAGAGAMETCQSEGRGGVCARMELLVKALADRRVKWGLAAICVSGAAAVWLAWRAGLDLEDVKHEWRALNGYLLAHPGALFWALVLLPGLPVPTSALLFTAGVVWRERPVMCVSLCLLAMALNLSWTYWLAAQPARGLAEKLLAKSPLRVPDLPRGNHLKLILILRLTPGLPFFVQNYALGFLRAPFALYLPISLLCSGIIGAGVVLSGVGIAGGKLRWAIVGVSLLAAAGIVTHLVRGWLAKRKGRRG